MIDADGMRRAQHPQAKNPEFGALQDHKTDPLNPALAGYLLLNCRELLATALRRERIKQSSSLHLQNMLEYVIARFLTVARGMRNRLDIWFESELL